MSKQTKAEPINNARLKNFIDRIEKLIEERAAISGDIKAVLSEAKGVGYDIKTMRRLVQVRAMDAADRAEAETLLDAYMRALGMDTSSNVVTIMPTEEDLEERASRIIHEVDRCMALAVDGKLPRIVAIQELIGCSAGKAYKLRGFVAERFSSSKAFHRENENSAAAPETGELPREMEEGDLGDFALIAPKPKRAPKEDQRPFGDVLRDKIAEAGLTIPRPQPETAALDTRPGGDTGTACGPRPAPVAADPDDGLDIPPYLKRAAVEATHG